MADAMIAAKAHAAALVSSAAPSLQRPKRVPKGRLVSLAALFEPAFRKSLRRALNGLVTDMAELGVKNEQELLEILVEARRRLDGTQRITATRWLGSAFEIIGARMPAYLAAEKYVTRELLSLVNARISREVGRFEYLNGYLEPAGVRSRFNRLVTVHSIWIRRPGQARGKQYVDRGLLFFNREGQALFLSTEFKTAGASGGLRRQIADRDARLLDAKHPEGTALVYQVEGSADSISLDLENVILIGRTGPADLQGANLASKLGVRAGSRSRLSVERDANGEPYIRIAIPVRTNSMRRVLERLLRDRTWQTL